MAKFETTCRIPTSATAGANPSDYTQLSFWTLEQILDDRQFVPEHIADSFCGDQILGIGGTVRQFILKCKAGMPWQEAGVKSAGNGALMRIATVLIPHLRNPTPELWAETAICAMLTHNDSASIASCVAFVRMLLDLLKADALPLPAWWLETFIATARELEIDDRYTSRSPYFADFRGTLWQLAERALAPAYEEGLSVVDACERWGSGAYLLETVPSVLYILMRHGDDPEQAIVRAVNDSKDNDTIGAIVGAAMGALHGRASLPRRWIDNLSSERGEKTTAGYLTFSMRLGSDGGDSTKIRGFAALLSGSSQQPGQSVLSLCNRPKTSCMEGTSLRLSPSPGRPSGRTPCRYGG